MRREAVKTTHGGAPGKLDEMSESEYAQFQAGMEMGDHCGSLHEIINLTENLDCYEVYPNIEGYDDLGRYYIEELEVMQVPEHLQSYIDYEAYGRDVAMDENGSFTDQGYVRDTGDRFCEYYDGERGSIPDEYRVMTFQDDLPEEEKSEWAMDIAFDMAEVMAALNDPAKSRVDEMLAAAERAEREYAAEAAAYVQTPADIVAQAQAVQDQAAENSFSIYQLKGGNETLVMALMASADSASKVLFTLALSPLRAKPAMSVSPAIASLRAMVSACSDL